MVERKRIKGNNKDLTEVFTKATAYTALWHFHLPKIKLQCRNSILWILNCKMEKTRQEK
jgi:hypothetical protein